MLVVGRSTAKRWYASRTRRWSVAEILAKLCEILNGAEMFCVLSDIFVNCFEELLLSY
jgi:hypothetical protein